MLNETKSADFMFTNVFLLFCLVIIAVATVSMVEQTIGLQATQDRYYFLRLLSVSALCAQVCYGFIQDKLGLRKNLLWYISIMLALSGPAFITFGYLLKVNLILGSIFGGLYIGLTFNGGIGVLESFTERSWSA